MARLTYGPTGLQAYMDFYYPVGRYPIVTYSPQRTREEREYLITILANISGALVDAGTVKVGDPSTYADAIRELTKQRDETKAT